MKFKNRIIVNTSAVLVVCLALSLPAFADSEAYVFNGYFASGTTEIWTDTTVLGGATVAPGTNITYNLECWGSGGELGKIGVFEQNASRNYRSELYLYDSFYGTSGITAASVSSPTAASAGSTIRYFIRVYPDSGYPTGYKIDGNVTDPSSHGTGYLTLGNGHGNYIALFYADDFYQGCNKGNYTHSYTNSYYKNGTFSTFNVVSNPSNYPDSGCPTYGGSYGTLNGGASANLTIY